LARTNGLAYGGIALYGDGHDDAAATAACDTMFDLMFGDYRGIAFIDSIANDGGYFETCSPYISVIKDYTRALWAWETGSTDVAPPDSSSCLEGMCDYLVWGITCDSGFPPASEAYAFGESKQSDATRHAGTRFGTRWYFNFLAQIYQDPQGKWMEEQFIEQEFTYFNGIERADYIISVDTALVAISPVTADWPEAVMYDVGTVFMRDGWDLSDSSEDIWCVYRHEQYPFGHAHADAGHFTIMRGQDVLLPDTGVYITIINTSWPDYPPSPSIYEMDHHEAYFSATIAHNCPTIKLYGEEFPGDPAKNTGGQYIHRDHPVLLSDYTTRMAGVDGRGSITDFEIVTDELVYIRSDLTDAYVAAKVETVRREFVWLEEHDAFLIFDKVKLDSTGFLQKQLFHMIPEPTTTATTATWTEGDSQVKLTSLYGLSSMNKVGGTGYKYWCYDANMTDYEEGKEYDEGDYRIELLPARTSDERWMLTALQVTESASPSYETLTLLEEGDYIGVDVNGDTLLFHKYGGNYVTGLGGGGGSSAKKWLLSPTLNPLRIITITKPFNPR